MTLNYQQRAFLNECEKHLEPLPNLSPEQKFERYKIHVANYIINLENKTIPEQQQGFWSKIIRRADKKIHSKASANYRKLWKYLKVQGYELSMFDTKEKLN